MSTKKTVLICLVILLLGAAAVTVIFISEPKAERRGAVQKTAMLVDVTGVEKGTFRPLIRAMGTVEPSQDVELSPQVGGEVVRLSDSFTPGGFVRKGQMLLQIDPADYRNDLEQHRSALSQASADLNIELGRQEVAQQDFELLGDSLSLQNRDLVLREPQLDAARSRVEAARAAVEQAELELRRTTIRAPFDAHVLTRNANVGSQVAPGESLGRLVALDTYWVVATVPQAQLRWLTFPGEGAEPSAVRVRNRTAWAEDEYRSGTLHRMIGALEEETRLARIIVDVHDPMSYQSDNADAPPLMIGSFVEATIEGKELRDVIRLNRDFVRENDTVWVMEDGALRIRKVDITFRDARYAYISEGLDPQARVVTTNLSTVVEGAALRVEETDSVGSRHTSPEADVDDQSAGSPSN